MGRANRMGMVSRAGHACSYFALVVLSLGAGALASSPSVRVSSDSRGFVTSGNKPFIPWGFNYDRDFKLRLLEEYWETEWDTVEQDFREMKQLGANVVRIHLQFAKFMRGPDKP